MIGSNKQDDRMLSSNKQEELETFFFFQATELMVNVTINGTLN